MGLEGTVSPQPGYFGAREVGHGWSVSQRFIDIVCVWFCYLGLRGRSPRYAFYFVCFCASVCVALPVFAHVDCDIGGYGEIWGTSESEMQRWPGLPLKSALYYSGFLTCFLNFSFFST